MADITALSAAIDKVTTDVNDMKTRVTTDIQALKDEVAALGGQTVTQDQIDSLTAKLSAVDATVQGVDVPAPQA